MSEKQIQIIEKHPRAIRWFHWVHFPLMMLMIWSGLLIYWANEAYITVPESWAKALGMASGLADGMAWHFTLMWIFAANGALYVLYLSGSGEWRELLPDRRAIGEALGVVLHDLGLRKTLPEPRGKFNGAQRFAYTGVLVLGFGLILTGLAIYKPVQLGSLTELLGGYEAARLEHFILMSLVVLFFIVHLAQVLKAGWNNFRAMVTGYEIDDK